MRAGARVSKPAVDASNACTEPPARYTGTVPLWHVTIENTMLYQVLECMRAVEQGASCQVIAVSFRPLLKEPKSFKSGREALLWGKVKFPLLCSRVVVQGNTK